MQYTRHRRLARTESRPPMDIRDIETPACLIDLDVVDRNIHAAQAQFDQLGIRLRPHIKTHKLVRLARMQLAAGATGITCQKTSEAEVFARAGCTDITITFNILGNEKLARLRALASMAHITVVADNAQVVAGLSAAFHDSWRPLAVLVECDTGLGRCGVQSPQAAVELAQLISSSKGLHFAGLMTYPPPEAHEAVETFMAEAREGCLAAVGSCPVITSGGTPSMKSTPGAGVVTEYRPGTYIYNDRSLLARGACTLADCAFVVAATVVSRPTEDRAILDAGSKTLSSDLFGLSGHGLIREYPDAVIAKLSEEHGHVDLSACRGARPVVGERVTIIPNHVCVVTNLFDQVHLHRSGHNVEIATVDARGRVL